MNYRWMAAAVMACAAWNSSAIAETNLAKAVAETKSAVAQELRDPRSAYYRNVGWKRLDTSHVLICGEVNARNALGGYVGFVRFFSLGDSAKVDYEVTPSVEPFRREMFEAFYEELCLKGQLAPIKF